MTDSDKLIDLLKRKSKLVAMLAPSFPIMYDSKKIVSQLKCIGFEKVVEVSVGAKETNRQLVEFFKKNPQARVITSPCASFVRFIRTRYPEFIKYLALNVDSPMVATAKIVKEKYPGFQPVFIGPCIVKKLEASQDYPELNILVLTYKELEEVFSKINIDQTLPVADLFDLAESSTRMYPTDGGLTDSSGIKNILGSDAVRIVSGYKNCEAALTEFKSNPKIQLVDILFCQEGCINGPGISSSLTIEERKKKISEYSTSQPD
ncbi:MAG: [Fe-Fe] hydrogenase large subunit C-terminal domain-containing protein [Patescibacteria group bacterium]|jgi:iron only hydrogenase large subunit-like protein